ncbi:hypothetical protein SAMN05444920_13393 [Nonomuraea solani]|uniref:Uncharacterized protein n=1 Tax=Nonomuraea solani TaxID=1144553 RepID=A0A1H6F1V9_9ACTN|nr:hypothetical protein [Nonomuraea solani]SEH03189.1 hypothetical protein SAMN05444920_13393 [Nonomuraea solani]
MRELLEIHDAAGADSVFVLALDDFPHRPDGDPRDDLDLAAPASTSAVIVTRMAGNVKRGIVGCRSPKRHIRMIRRRLPDTR